MLIHPNIPSWGWQELTHAVAAMTSGPAGARQLERLRASIARSVPGWNPVLVGSGRYALQLAIETLALPACRLAVPAYVCPAVVTAIRAAGAAIVPIDCLPRSVRFDPVALQEAVDAHRVDAVIAANTYGLDQDFATLARLGIPIIDDAAYQAGESDGLARQPCGTRGAAGIWSFNFKALSGLGGGVLLLPPTAQMAVALPSRRAHAADLTRLVDYGVRSIVRHHIPRILPSARYRDADSPNAVRPAWTTVRRGAMSALQAAVALGQWEKRADVARRQAAHAARLIGALSGCEAFASFGAVATLRSPHFMPVLVRASGGDALAAVEHARRCLYAHGVQTETAYPIVLGSATSVPSAADLSARLFLLPCHAGLEEKQIDRIHVAIRRASDELVRRFRPDRESGAFTALAACSVNTAPPS